MVSARREGERLVVFIPGWMSAEQERDWVAEMVRRVEASEARRRSPGRNNDEALMRRGLELSKRWLEGRARPSSIRWVPTMRTRWASCTPDDATIRISERLRDAPGWVWVRIASFWVIFLPYPHCGGQRSVYRAPFEAN